MTFDIQYLLLLQNLRSATGGVFDEFFNGLSKFAVDLLPFLPFVVFWCVHKKWGYRYLATLWLGEVVNGLIKLSVCAYRPWIRSDLIEPAGDSKVAATGYSFPSGHTVNATAHYGNTFVWQKNKRRWLAVLCAVLIALTAFSRNFLGVHTPQDVVVGFGETALIIFLVGLGQKKLQGKEKLKDILTAVGFGFIFLAIAYILMKPYPMDYVDGVLLVDPQKMMNDTFKACGGLTGFLIGSYLDRHYIHYKIPKGAETLPLMACVGVAILRAWNDYFAHATVVAAFGPHWGRLVAYAVMVLFGMTVWPMLIMKMAAKKEKAVPAEKKAKALKA